MLWVQKNSVKNAGSRNATNAYHGAAIPRAVTRYANQERIVGSLTVVDPLTAEVKLRKDLPYPDLSGVLTYHNNTSRDGTNIKEFALTASNVTTPTFGKLFSCQADGAIAILLG